MISQRFCPPLLDKNRNYEGIWSNKRKSFVKPVGMNGSNFKNETLFVSFTAIITTRNGWNGTNCMSQIELLAALKWRAGLTNDVLLFVHIYPFIVSVFVQQGRKKALTSHLFTPLFHVHPPPTYSFRASASFIDRLS